MNHYHKNKRLQWIKLYIEKTKEDHISAYGAQMAYFVVLSFIPFLLFLTTIIRCVPLTYDVIRQGIIGFVPGSFQGVVLDIMEDVYRRSKTVLPVSAVTSLWTAGRSIQAMIHGLNTIYCVRETRNWIVSRIYSVFYMIIFSVSIIVSLLVLVLGKRLQRYFMEYIPVIGELMGAILRARSFLVFIVLFFTFLMLYKVLPNRKGTFYHQVPGALFTAVAWMLSSFAFSVYFIYSPGILNIYGSLAALIILMLWIYACMYLVLIGAEINSYFEGKKKTINN